AVEILRRRFVEGDPEMAALIRKAKHDASVAQQVYDLRTQAGLTQKQLADLVKSQPSAICRLEDADYEGHSLGMLRRIAAALGKQVVVTFIPAERRPPPRKTAAQPAGPGSATSKKRMVGRKKAAAKKGRSRP
ncbi:MAG TPA: helix-turn-helix transcriptional regulator, partial [Gemmataceae bacterium]|nr:helix-turn-helix transcriptional regulator [Gemmataceae bacterium]